MADYWQLNIASWNLATDDMALELEGALLRICNAIRLYDRPISANLRVLGGLWRCNERKAKRLLDDLVATGEIWVDDGLIYNERAVDEASNYRRRRVECASNGRQGGIESGKSRRKALENKDQCEAPASTIKERKEEKEDSGGGSAHAREDFEPPDPVTEPIVSKEQGPTMSTQREQLLAAMGCDPSGLTGPNGKIIGRVADMRLVEQWMTDLGLSFPEVLTIVGEVMATRRDPGPPSTFAYFTEAMRRAAGTINAPQLTPITTSTGGTTNGHAGPHNSGAANGYAGRTPSRQVQASANLAASFQRTIHRLQGGGGEN